jgi:hypothetical protein
MYTWFAVESRKISQLHRIHNLLYILKNTVRIFITVVVYLLYILYNAYTLRWNIDHSVIAPL